MHLWAHKIVYIHHMQNITLVAVIWIHLGTPVALRWSHRKSYFCVCRKLCDPKRSENVHLNNWNLLHHTIARNTHIWSNKVLNQISMMTMYIDFLWTNIFSWSFFSIFNFHTEIPLTMFQFTNVCFNSLFCHKRN